MDKNEVIFLAILIGSTFLIKQKLKVADCSCNEPNFNWRRSSSWDELFDYYIILRQSFFFFYSQMVYLNSKIWKCLVFLLKYKTFIKYKTYFLLCFLSYIAIVQMITMYCIRCRKFYLYSFHPLLITSLENYSCKSQSISNVQYYWYNFLILFVWWQLQNLE